MKKIKIAQIGTGHDHAGVVFSALRQLTDVFEVVGYAKVPEDEPKYEWSNEHFTKMAFAYENAKEYTVEEILSMPDLDAVAIETFDLNLVKYAQMAVDKGLHIHMDKAAGESVEDYEKLLSDIKKKGLAFSIGYMYRFNPAIIDVFERVKNGEFGKLNFVDTEMSCHYYDEKRKWLEQLQGGMMQYLGCHLVDLVVRLCGVPNEIIPLNTSSNINGINANDIAFAVFKYSDIMATIKSSLVDVGGFSRRHFTVNGQNGSMHIVPLEKSEPKQNGYLSALSTKAFKCSLDDTWGAGEKINYEVFDRYQNMLRTFADIIKGKRDYFVDLETEARVQRCMLSATGMKCDYKGKINL